MKTFLVKIVLNGQKHYIYANKSLFIKDILIYCNFKSQPVLIEQNGRIHDSLNTNDFLTPIKQNDRIEIITIVGGG
nr:hypothetical protein [Ishige okamurae]